ncbi:uncharacterized protein TEOVI_000801300 [Trypanosoma equiperdum]|uniref:Uncharacterized protein n=4 Tax=Trypanozoon TaxID=39700 RepID=Q57X30_TRYB2|nr:hypothetical protein, conserved [Trypanosoma brucei gambiense DAL972]XP_847382.1 hypothetical protein, conserved [Trypanosoma brucei brucei TREU927]AAX69863.1 hypothetical protein, conserved [Trypanosoma brucei]RHW72742.1 hypothetical protein DPX39_040062700 [Trypanosoma brucei equiperdum]SCU67189.1 hypothetical protein, conserved [Trypanosoma equiperdum]AAZ13316.1 hypothetical protein, conserved [Trypanosoma brucei brucei TREU927]CBH13611.1 hypothetical protein, conserved [Trypanosoma bru|eukprot:XP_011775887.1 hypothetical protein, conserved [Trypanosoma brucei gambiense DAL972]
MPHITTPFFVTLRSGERLRLNSGDDGRLPRFLAAVKTLVFTRQLPSNATTAVGATPTTATVSVIAHSNGGEGHSDSSSFTIFSHTFDVVIGVNSGNGKKRPREEEPKGERAGAASHSVSTTDTFSVRLRSPVWLTSGDLVNELEVKSMFGKGADDGGICAVTLCGTQQTILSKQQVSLLRSTTE